MGPGASIFERPVTKPRDRRGMVWSSVIAILFATFAAISFAIDQSVTVSILTDLQIESE